MGFNMITNAKVEPGFVVEIDDLEKRILDLELKRQKTDSKENEDIDEGLKYPFIFGFQLRPDIFKKLTPSLIMISIVTMILMGVYEFLKQTISPNLSLWQSHLVTILFSSIIAPIGGYLALRKIEILRQKGIKEIEERKKAEEELKRTQGGLELKIKARTEELLKTNALLNLEIKKKLNTEIELIEAKERAEKSDRLKSEFLAQISHEIRTPINSILSFSSLIKEDIEHKVGDDLRAGFNVISSAGKRIIRTIDLILNMSELQTGTFEYMPRKINVCKEVLEKIYVEYEPLACEKNLKFTITKNVDLPLIYADEHTVQQIFNHLIDNAIKFTNTGEIKVTIDANEERNIVVHVSDTGIGISKEYMNEIYKPFLQENNGYTREYDGNGLGLALVKKYCDLNKAKILLESEKGKGTTFSIVFSK